MKLEWYVFLGGEEILFDVDAGIKKKFGGGKREGGGRKRKEGG